MDIHIFTYVLYNLMCMINLSLADYDFPMIARERDRERGFYTSYFYYGKNTSPGNELSMR